MVNIDDIKKSLHSSLQELGLGEAESMLYMTSLALGPTTIADLATHLGMARPNVYKVIEQLEKHGLAKFSDRPRYTRMFMVETPTKLLELVRQKRDRMAGLDHALVAVMPDLLAAFHQGETSTNIRIIQGKEQYLKIFHTMLDEAKDEIRFFGSAADFIQFVTWTGEKIWIQERVKRGIKIQSLVLPSEDAKRLRMNDPQELRVTKVLSGASPFVTSFQLYANKVVIWQPKAPLAILIEDQFITQMLQSMFSLLWSQSEKSQGS